MQNINESIRIGSVRGIQLAIDSGVDINQSMGPGDDRSLLHFAVDVGRPNVIDILLKSGARIDNNVKMWETVMRNQCSTDVFEYLFSSLRDQLSISSAGQFEGHALTAAAWDYLRLGVLDVALYGTPAMLSRMIFHGYPMGRIHVGRVIREILIAWGKSSHENPRGKQDNLEKVRLLIRVGGNMDSIPGDLSLLQIAIDLEQGINCDLVRLLLEAMDGSDDINCEYFIEGDQAGSLYRHSVIFQSRSILVHNICRRINSLRDDNRACMTTALLEYGADFKTMWHGVSPLFIALERELHHEQSPRVSVLDVLLSHMTINEVRMPATSSGRSLVLQTLLPRYSSKSKSDTLKKLLAAGADQNAIDGETGETPLYAFMSRILQQGMDLYSPTAYNDEDHGLMLILLENPGLDVFRKNRDGATVVDLVNERISEWHMGRPLYEVFYRVVTKDYEDARICFAMALHKDIGPASYVSNFPIEMMQSVLDRKHYFLLPDVGDVFADNTPPDTDEDEFEV